MNFDQLVEILAQTHRSLQQQSAQAIDFSLVVRNWLFGYHIVYPSIHQTVSGELMDRLPLMELRQKFRLSWSHYQILMSLHNPEECSFYEIEATNNRK